MFERTILRALPLLRGGGEGNAQLRGGDVKVFPTLQLLTYCMHANTTPRPHMRARMGTKSAGQQKQTPLECGLFMLVGGHRETVRGPPTLQTEHLKP